MKVEIVEERGTTQRPSGIAQRIAAACDRMEVGKLLTVAAIAEKLGVRRGTPDHCHRELAGYTTIRLVHGRWRRLFGHPKTIAALDKEDAHAKR